VSNSKILANALIRGFFFIKAANRLSFPRFKSVSAQRRILQAEALALRASSKPMRSERRRILLYKRLIHFLDLSEAEITIRMKNQGPEAFRPHIYGKTIIIHRIIKKDGTGRWQLKNAEGKVVGRTKRDLDEITEHMNIQVISVSSF
jgi:chromosome segregation ATPase